MNILLQNPALWGMMFNNNSNSISGPVPLWLWILVALVGVICVGFIGYLILEITKMK